jgi:hypothetical protein
VHRPLRAHRSRPVPLDEVLERADLLIIGAPHRRTGARRPASPGGRRVEPARSGRAGVSPRVSVVIPVYNEGDHIVPVPRPAVRGGHPAVRGARRLRHPDDTTRPVLEAYARRGTPPRAHPQHRRARPGQRDPLRHRPARRPSWSSRWPTAATTPCRSTLSPGSSSAGVVVAAASRYMRGGQQVGGPWLKQMLSKTPGSRLYHLAPGGHPRRHQLVQGLRHPVRPFRSGSRATAASRSASSWWPRPAGCASRWPSCRPSGSTARSASPTSSSRPGCRATSLVPVRVRAAS